ncbi:hypothetical protein [Actinomadura sp. WAC 06369]|uniref:hypothetical protein n=1 Tax=Actinomadura sp. WAC 06369 TaxID=2203193 RepID=UPI000F787BD4|nr:hypothetical protein [Actinomadura sp. WAC 06369]
MHAPVPSGAFGQDGERRVGGHGRQQVEDRVALGAPERPVQDLAEDGRERRRADPFEHRGEDVRHQLVRAEAQHVAGALELRGRRDRAPRHPACGPFAAGGGRVGLGEARVQPVRPGGGQVGSDDPAHGRGAQPREPVEHRAVGGGRQLAHPAGAAVPGRPPQVHRVPVERVAGALRALAPGDLVLGFDRAQLDERRDGEREAVLGGPGVGEAVVTGRGARSPGAVEPRRDLPLVGERDERRGGSHRVGLTVQVRVRPFGQAVLEVPVLAQPLPHGRAHRVDPAERVLREGRVHLGVRGDRAVGAGVQAVVPRGGEHGSVVGHGTPR